MGTTEDGRELWRVGRFSCAMVTCCAGAELQLLESHDGQPDAIVLRELYPTKSDLYERARDLKCEYGCDPP